VTGPALALTHAGFVLLDRMLRCIALGVSTVLAYSRFGVARFGGLVWSHTVCHKYNNRLASRLVWHRRVFMRCLGSQFSDWSALGVALARVGFGATGLANAACRILHGIAVCKIGWRLDLYQHSIMPGSLALQFA
jgi:hypothetical protein